MIMKQVKNSEWRGGRGRERERRGEERSSALLRRPGHRLRDGEVLVLICEED